MLGRVVVNCTGVHSDKIRQKDDPLAKELVVPSEGTHLTFNTKFINKEYGILIPKTHDHRMLFVLPW